jgi:hypothetical protein
VTWGGRALDVERPPLDDHGGLSKSPELISALVSSAFVIKYTLFGSARLPGNGFSIR